MTIKKLRENLRKSSRSSHDSLDQSHDHLVIDRYRDRLSSSNKSRDSLLEEGGEQRRVTSAVTSSSAASATRDHEISSREYIAQVRAKYRSRDNLDDLLTNHNSQDYDTINTPPTPLVQSSYTNNSRPLSRYRVSPAPTYDADNHVVSCSQEDTSTSQSDSANEKVPRTGRSTRSERTSSGGHQRDRYDGGGGERHRDTSVGGGGGSTGVGVLHRSNSGRESSKERRSSKERSSSSRKHDAGGSGNGSGGSGSKTPRNQYPDEPEMKRSSLGRHREDESSRLNKQERRRSVERQPRESSKERQKRKDVTKYDDIPQHKLPRRPRSTKSERYFEEIDQQQQQQQQHKERPKTARDSYYNQYRQQDGFIGARVGHERQSSALRREASFDGFSYRHRKNRDTTPTSSSRRHDYNESDASQRARGKSQDRAAVEYHLKRQTSSSGSYPYAALILRNPDKK